MNQKIPAVLFLLCIPIAIALFLCVQIKLGSELLAALVAVVFYALAAVGISKLANIGMEKGGQGEAAQKSLLEELLTGEDEGGPSGAEGKKNPGEASTQTNGQAGGGKASGGESPKT